MLMLVQKFECVEQLIEEACLIFKGNANLCLKDKNIKIELNNKYCIEKINFKFLKL